MLKSQNCQSRSLFAFSDCSESCCNSRGSKDTFGEHYATVLNVLTWFLPEISSGRYPPIILPRIRLEISPAIFQEILRENFVQFTLGNPWSYSENSPRAIPLYPVDIFALSPFTPVATLRDLQKNYTVILTTKPTKVYSMHSSSYVHIDSYNNPQFLPECLQGLSQEFLSKFNYGFPHFIH